jgi:GNAT superfamily N-acetyltransferase
VTEPLMSRVRDEAALRRWQQVTSASFAADFVGFPADPIEESRPALVGLYGDEEVAFYVGDVDRVPVVAVVTRLPVHDNVDLANVGLRVHPDHRRRGYGRSALDATIEALRAAGRRKVLFEIPTATRTEDPAAGELFAASIGARSMIGEKRRLLDVRGLAGRRLASLLGEATEAAAGYSTVAWVDHTPEPYLADMVALRTLMSIDPPQGELELEPERWDVARYLAVERSYVERGRRHLVVAAREDSSGRVIGYTELGVPSGGATVGYQWDTIVHADHRGHRLGLLLKLANLAELRRQLPEVRYLNTWNADDNAHMVAVNELLGFKTMEGWSEWQLDL